MTGAASQLTRKIASWRSLPRRVQAMLLLSWCLLGIARLAVLLVPFRWIAAWLGSETGVAPFTPLLLGQETELARDVGQSIALAARYTPWESLCQPQALVARFWLGLFGIPCIVNYGVRKDEKYGLAAHAWVCTGPVAVTGGQAWEEFVVVRSFVTGANP